MKNLERDRRRKKGAIGSQDGGFRTFERRTGHADGRSATCILVGGADVTVYSVWDFVDHDGPLLRHLWAGGPHVE